jgi:hypothetical protein
MTPLQLLKLSALLLLARITLRYWARLERSQRETLGLADADVVHKVRVWVCRCASMRAELELQLGATE